nr:GNAT family N-acetyltransferase [bacterium]
MHTIRHLPSAGTAQLLAFMEEVNMAPEEYFDAIYRFDPYSARSHSLGVFEGDALVSHLRYNFRPTHGAATPIDTFAVANVGTRESFRGRGYCRMLLERGLELARKSGADFATVLSGVGVYKACGWEEVARRVYRLPLEGISVPGPRDIRLHVFDEGDISALAELYDTFCQGRPLCVRRSYDYWRHHLKWAHEAGCQFLVARRGEAVVGYIRLTGASSLTPHVVELVTSPSCPAALRAFLHYFHRMHLKPEYAWSEVVLHLPSDHPLLAMVAPSLVAQQQPYLLVHVVNIQSWLEKMQVDMQHRLLGCKAPPFTLNLACAGQRVTLRWDGRLTLSPGGEGVVRCLSRADFCRVMFGWARPSQAWQPEGLGLTPAQIRALDAMMDIPCGIYWPADGV